MKIKNQTINSLKRYDILNHWINNCDSKSSFLLGFNGVIITLIASSKLINSMKSVFLSRPSVNCIDFNSIKVFLSLLVLLGFVFYTIKTFYFIYNTLKARINAEIYSQNLLNTNSNIFFLNIAKNKYEDFSKIINNENKSQFLNDLNSQIYINSCIATSKFINYNKSLNSTFIGIICLIFFVLLS
jgi:hypothetical protein